MTIKGGADSNEITTSDIDHLSVFDASELVVIERAFPPGDERPMLDIPRHWSNPSLREPETIIALVLSNPTTEELARTIVAYGPSKTLSVLRELIAVQELTDLQFKLLSDLLRPVMKGVADAARQLLAR